MRCFISISAFLLLIGTSAVRAQNPDDLQFRVRFASGSNTYHVGEPIPMEITYSTKAEKKYYGSFTTPQPGLDSITIAIVPASGFIDPRSLLEVQGWAGDFLGGSGTVTSQPYKESFDLTEWFRFQKPGFYSIRITSKQLSRIKTSEEGGGKEQLTLISDPIRINVVAADPDWVAAQLDDIDQELRSPGAPGQRTVALHRLALLDAPASVQRLVQLYLENPQGSESWILPNYLQESSQTEEIIQSLQSALKDPEATIPDSLIRVLANLQTRENLGLLPAYPEDPEKRKTWNEEIKARSKVREEYLAKDQATLDATIQQRSGSSRAAAIYQAWFEAEQRNPTSPVPPARLEQLRLDVLSVAGDLNFSQRVQLLVTGWQTMPHEQLLPLILQLSQESSQDPDAFARLQAYQLWCQDWPRDCESAILSDVAASKIKTPLYIILLLHEAERPQLDPLLRQALEAQPSYDSSESQSVAALVLRAGSRNLVPLVDAKLDKMGNRSVCLGRIQGYLLGYLFRVSAEDARKRLEALLQNAKGYCGSEVLRILNSSHYSSDMIPVTTRALFSPNLQAAATAALFLGEHGSPESREFLWKRLEALWKDWAGHSADLAGPFVSPGGSAAGEAEGLQEALASALAHAKNWKLSQEELDRLRAGCLTEQCRAIAEGKMTLGF